MQYEARNNVPLFLIFTLFILAFFANSFVEYHLIPPHLTLLTEVCLIILIPCSLLRSKGERYCLSIGYVVAIFILITFLSMLINSQLDVRFVYSWRCLFRFFFLYLAVINLRLSEEDLKRINRVIYVIFLIQLPVVAIKYHFYGISELTLGTYHARGGSLTTAIPLTAVIYLFSYYGLYKSSVLYILLAIGFMLFAIVGAKRLPFYLFPFVALGMYYLIYVREMKGKIFKRGFVLCVTITGIFLISALFLKYSPSLNPYKKDGQNVDIGDLKQAVKFAREYTMRKDAYMELYTYGRIATTQRVFRVIYDSGIGNFLFGLGPGTYTRTLLDPPNWESKSAKLLKIRYGITPMNRIAIEYGLLGVVAYAFVPLYFVFMCWKYYKLEADPYWKAFATGSFGFAFLMFFLFLGYHYPIFLGDTMPVLYFYVMAVVYYRLKVVSLDRAQPQK
jgi:hypothetical protein